jgi:hypothetical protein
MSTIIDKDLKVLDDFINRLCYNDWLLWLVEENTNHSAKAMSHFYFL